ncbi:hypothetical protein [Nocardioides sp. 616]|uniref:hypothetical protein n=1 Tax=Nocardioides sp. 616 TaxID=2268090 RepID=UPI001F0701E8|nr:hypothetical protein [Nocardioides sp. 616]
MVILGLVFVAVGVLAILSATFVSEGNAELLGMDLSALAIFLVGVAAGACVICGLSILKWGTKRGLASRREQKELRELHAKLERVEGERHGEHPTSEG